MKDAFISHGTCRFGEVSTSPLQTCHQCNVHLKSDCYNFYIPIACCFFVDIPIVCFVLAISFCSQKKMTNHEKMFSDNSH